ncbi:MAG: Hsp20/alpha crystallin family protein [Campylobacterales bacterium]|nr:Hsp20/alpha crystallin family protein [Campylobacterales bacterium]
MSAFSKRLLISLGALPLMLSAATTAPQNPPAKTYERECPFCGMEEWNRFFVRPFHHTGSAYGVSTMKETNKIYLISIDLPGMDKKDISIETLGNRLMVSGERKEENEIKEGSKRTYTQFRQSYLLPDDADLSAITATSKNGVLKITVPKSATKKNAKKIEIK